MNKTVISLWLLVIAFTVCLAKPDDADDKYEAEQTEKVLSIPVRDFPKPQGPTGFDELPADSPQLVFTAVEQKLSGPEPPEWYAQRRSVTAKAPDGSKIEAYCCSADDEALAAGHGFTSTLLNRRHRYGNKFDFAFYPKNVYVGKREAGKLQAQLFFRDVGSHSEAPHHLAVDKTGKCHLIVADVFVERNNRLKLYWCVGDLSAGKWLNAWLIDHRTDFPGSAKPWTASWKDTIHLIWLWHGGLKKGGEICYVDSSPNGFGRKIVLQKGTGWSRDVAIDPVSGRLLIVTSNRKGVFVQSRQANGQWTLPGLLHSEEDKSIDVSVESSEKGTFIVRAKGREVKEWLLTIK